MAETGFGLKAATITPEGADDVGSPNRLLREAIDGKVIVRTGRRIPGVSPLAGIHHPISVVRMAVGDAYGAEEWREHAERRRGRSSHGADPPLRLPRRRRVRLPDRGADRGPGLRRAEVDGQPRLRGDAEGGDGCRRGAPSGGRLRAAADRRHLRRAAHRPRGAPLVIPGLNRDGDLLSDLVLPLFGSIAGAESVLLSLDDELRVRGRDGGGAARHGARAGGQGHRQPDGDDPRRRRAAPTPASRGVEGADAPRGRSTRRCSRPPRPASAPRTWGHAGTTEFTDAVIERARAGLV